MIGEKLKKAIEKSGVTASDISRKTGIPASRISEITSGKTKNPGVDTLYRITQALGVSLDHVISEGEETPYQAKVINKEIRSDEEDLLRYYEALPSCMREALLLAAKGMAEGAKNNHR